jgi:hypothetical protein
MGAESCLTSDFRNKVVILDAPWKAPLRLGLLGIKDVVVKLVAAGAANILCKCLQAVHCHAHNLTLHISNHSAVV